LPRKTDVGALARGEVRTGDFVVAIVKAAFAKGWTERRAGRGSSCLSNGEEWAGSMSEALQGSRGRFLGGSNLGSFEVHAEGTGNMKTTLIFGVVAVLVPVISVTAAEEGQAQGDVDNGRAFAFAADKQGAFYAQAAQPGQQQPPPQYTKEQIEDLKKQNDRAQKQNALIKQAMDAMTAKNWQAAVAPLQQLIADEPNNWEYHSSMGDVQLNLGAYEPAIAAYEKGIGLANAGPGDPAKKKAAIGRMLTQEGNAYLKLRKNKEAVAAYSKAASLDPNPGTAYFNLCATQYNIGNVEGALGACDKAIAADPKKADAYFIKGSLLIAESKTDSSGKVTAPPGAAQALKKYLELAPNGAHAKDVKEMLGFIGSNVETTYQKGKGK
jgi:tetratricopeptide (TPR) repeat protein